MHPELITEWTEWRGGKAHFRAKFHRLSNEIQAEALVDQGKWGGSDLYEFKLGLAQLNPNLDQKQIMATVEQIFFAQYPEFSKITTRLEDSYVMDLETKYFPEGH